MHATLNARSLTLEHSPLVLSTRQPTKYIRQYKLKMDGSERTVYSKKSSPYYFKYNNETIISFIECLVWQTLINNNFTILYGAFHLISKHMSPGNTTGNPDWPKHISDCSNGLFHGVGSLRHRSLTPSGIQRISNDVVSVAEFTTSCCFRCRLIHCVKLKWKERTSFIQTFTPCFFEWIASLFIEQI